MRYIIEVDEENEIAALKDEESISCILPHREANYVINCINNFYYRYSAYYVDEYNNKIADEAYERWMKSMKQTTEPLLPKYVKDTRSGYVYIMKCHDKYKIGFSKDVDRRFKELNDKPFPLQLIYKQFFEDGRTVEKILHEEMKEYNTNYEWYEFTEEQVDKIITRLLSWEE